MAKGENQKLKLLYLLDILNKYTDDGNLLTMQEIVKRLSEYRVNAERKTLYTDVDFSRLRNVLWDDVKKLEISLCLVKCVVQ